MPRVYTPSPSVNASFVTGTAEAGLQGELVLGSAVIMSGTLAARPAPGTAGRIYFATDVPGIPLYRDTGAAWDPIFHVEAKSTAGAAAVESVTWTTAYAAAPIVTVAVLSASGSDSSLIDAQWDSRSTTGATVWSRYVSDVTPLTGIARVKTVIAYPST